MRFRLLLATVVCACFLLITGSAQALQLGFNDEDLLHAPNSYGYGTGVDDAGLASGLARARQAGASIWRIQIRWANVAPGAPPSPVVAADPGWSGYQWAEYDRQIRAVVAAGLRPLVWLGTAPGWAEGAGRPPLSTFYPVGTWKPDPNALRPFAAAVARRYGGRFPDPLAQGENLPRVATFQAWNEPNIYVDLMPQYGKTGDRYVQASADVFRTLVNAIYDGVKSVDPTATVIAGAMAPFGDYPDGGNRTPPVEFWRALLCIEPARGKLRASRSCPQIRFDAYAHHPYSPYPPTRKGSNVDDATVPDIGKISRLVKLGTAAGTIRPAGRKPLWITEISWDSTPDPHGLSPATQASYMQGAVNVLARQGAEVILFWNSRDDAPIPSYPETSQSGIFFRAATPSLDIKKPSWTAFRFPFTAYRSGSTALLWGKAPQRGTVTVEQRKGQGWKPCAVLTAGADGVFSKRIPTTKKAHFRALQGSFTSLVATQ